MTVGRIPSVEGGIQPTIFDAKGDLLTATANDTPARLAVGANNTFLRANSATATGLEYADAYTSYTPSLTNITIGNGSITGKYMRVGKMCQGEAVVVFGSTTSISGIPEIGLPFTSTSVSVNPCQATLLDSATAVYPALGYFQSTTTVRVLAINTAGTYAIEAGISATVPFTWTTNDRINVNFCFEVA
jgi:hypothetical protein